MERRDEHPQVGSCVDGQPGMCCILIGMWAELVGFAGVMALGQMTPGPDWILVTRGALAQGMATAVWIATGIACGLMVHAAVALGGLAVYVRDNEPVWGVTRWLAGGYLIWVALRLLSGSGGGDELGAERRGRGHPFFLGLFCNLLNAKVCLLLAAVCSGFLRGGHASHWPVVLWAVIVFQGWILWIVWAWLLQVGSVRACYGRYRRWLDTTFSAGLVLVAVKLFLGW